MSYPARAEGLVNSTTPDQSGPKSDSIEEMLCIPQSSSITGTSPSYCFVSYQGLPFWAGVWPLSKSVVVVFYSLSWLGNPGYNTKLSDGEVPVLQLWEMWSTPSLPGLLWPRVVLYARVSSMGQIKLFDHLTVQTNDC